MNLDLKNDEVTLIKSVTSQNILKYLRELLRSFVDAYLIVAQAIQCLQEMGLTIE